MSIDLSKVKDLVSQMTQEEKARMVSGADFWHTAALERLDIPSVMVSDGPHGLRTQRSHDESDHLGVNAAITAICFPAACATACSFDREMMYDMGTALGKECQAENVSTILGPAVNIKRSPLCGRNFEYVSEDPYVAGEMAVALISGVQSQNVGTSIKHFAANNQEHERMNGSSDVDERTLREIYLAPFETAVKEAQPWTVMCSYNRINGTYSSQNPWLLNKVLRDEWGFEGLVMSDWGAVSDRVSGIKAGMDLEMPGSNNCNDRLIIEAVRNGTLKEEDLDKCVERVVRLALRFNADRREEVFDRQQDHDKAVRVAENSLVLLKNEQVLPLHKEEKIALIGGFAAKPRYQGGGSSHITSYQVTASWPLAGEYGDVTYAEGFSTTEDIWDESLVSRAMETAAKADKIVVYAGLPDSFESEGYDRAHMRLPECQNRLIEQLLTIGKPVIVVLHNGSPVELPWADRVQGILEAYLGGEGVGKAVLEILYGRVNPSGKLAESFPFRLEDNPSYLNFPGKEQHVNYAEGIFVGYRYYDSKEMPVRYPFGYGLSYTTFDYSNLKIGKAPAAAASGVKAGEQPQNIPEITFAAPDGPLTFGKDDLVAVSLDVTNTGKMAGREIVQLYVADKTGAQVRPVHELKGFVSVFLEPGETKTVVMLLNYRSFAWYDTEQHDWYAANGLYELQIARSSRDIAMCACVELAGNKVKYPRIDRDVMLGDLLSCDKTAGYVREKLADMLNAMSGETQEGISDMAESLVRYMPLRALRSFVGMTNEQVDEIVADLKKIVEAQPDRL